MLRTARLAVLTLYRQNHSTGCRRIHTSRIFSCSKQDSGENEETSSSSDEAFEEEYTNDGVEQIRLEILSASLPFVHTDGWSENAIAQGAESLGYSGMAHGMFPDGGVELVNYFYRICNGKLEEILKEKVIQNEESPQLKQGTTAFIRDAVEIRLRMNIDYLDHWPQAMALHAAPSNINEGLLNVGTLVDHIWYYAGDRSHDFNWYTKRGLLFGVYKTTELCMVQDKSPDFEDTWSFLDRRLSDVSNVAKAVKYANSASKDVHNILQAGIVSALNIVGLNRKSR
ncbi:ubiquinone biosynthesis protein COQ9, mitochondrial-like isoform X2 [Oratosquilla oratoria]|uniref:ubiquinone biosynthesis protein COQ9, mitochondrial-like isoform X2 n=1 Tax=Oratosquilla oratoria TaxID=337810 RepID=UPI003F76190D